MRTCVHCQAPIPLARLVKSRWKSFVCSDECKNADYALIRAEKAKLRQEKGLCPNCGHKPKVRTASNARVQDLPWYAG
jgi:predicted RNA-binding Zn-ribbon protein involved in translation (DUF1610 family)